MFDHMFEHCRPRSLPSWAAVVLLDSQTWTRPEWNSVKLWHGANILWDGLTRSWPNDFYRDFQYFGSSFNKHIKNIQKWEFSSRIFDNFDNNLQVTQAQPSWRSLSTRIDLARQMNPLNSIVGNFPWQRPERHSQDMSRCWDLQWFYGILWLWFYIHSPLAALQYRSTRFWLLLIICIHT